MNAKECAIAIKHKQLGIKLTTYSPDVHEKWGGRPSHLVDKLIREYVAE